MLGGLVSRGWFELDLLINAQNTATGTWSIRVKGNEPARRCGLSIHSAVSIISAPESFYLRCVFEERLRGGTHLIRIRSGELAVSLNNYFSKILDSTIVPKSCARTLAAFHTLERSNSFGLWDIRSSHAPSPSAVTCCFPPQVSCAQRNHCLCSFGLRTSKQYFHSGAARQSADGSRSFHLRISF